MNEHVHHSEQTRAPRAFFRPKPDGKTDPAGEAGWYLERERERRGLSLQVVSQAIGVHPHHLRAIELGMLENLPERSLALRMIGDYAKYLGFDPQPLVAHFESCMPKEKAGRAFSSASIVAFPLLERLREMTRTPGGVTVSVLAAVLLFGGLAWTVWPGSDTAQKAPVVATAEKGDSAVARNATDGRKLVASTASVKEEPLKDDVPAEDPASAVAKTAAKASDPIGALIASTMKEESTAKDQQAVASVAEQAMDDAEKAEPQQVTEPEPRLHENAIRTLKAVPANGLALRAVEQIFLRLEDDSGKTWFAGFLNPGEVLALPQEVRLRLTAGDVNRLEWFANGQKMGRLARDGKDFLSEPLDRFYQQAGLVPRQAQRGG